MFRQPIEFIDIDCIKIERDEYCGPTEDPFADLKERESDEMVNDFKIELPLYSDALIKVEDPLTVERMEVKMEKAGTSDASANIKDPLAVDRIEVKLEEAGTSDASVDIKDPMTVDSAEVEMEEAETSGTSADIKDPLVLHGMEIKIEEAEISEWMFTSDASVGIKDPLAVDSMGVKVEEAGTSDDSVDIMDPLALESAEVKMGEVETSGASSDIKDSLALDGVEIKIEEAETSDVQPLSEPATSASGFKKEALPVVAIPTKGSSKRHFCTFCKKTTTKFARHISTVHKDHPEVLNLKNLSPNQRKVVFNSLRDKGTTEFNAVVPVPEQIVKRREIFNYCVFCGIKTKYLLRHFRTSHMEEKRVSRILALPINSCERRNAIRIITQDGFNLFSSSAKATEVCMRINIPCPNCSNVYSKLSLYKHYRKCTGIRGSRRIQQESRSFALSLPDSFSALKSLLRPLKDDDIRQIIINDENLLFLAQHWKEKFASSSHAGNQIRGDLRQLARVLKEATALDDTIVKFSQLFIPKYFDIFKTAVRNMGHYNVTDGTFSAPTVTVNIGLLMTRALKQLRIKFLKERDEILLKEFDIWKELYHSDFSTSIGYAARQSARQKKWNKP